MNASQEIERNVARENRRAHWIRTELGQRPRSVRLELEEPVVRDALERAYGAGLAAGRLEILDELALEHRTRRASSARGAFGAVAIASAFALAVLAYALVARLPLTIP